MITKERLKQRVSTALYNVAEAKDETIEIAVADALDISAGKKVKEQFVVDYAEIRVKKELKIGYDEEEYRWLIEYFSKADLIDDNGVVTPNRFFKVKTRNGVL